MMSEVSLPDDVSDVLIDTWALQSSIIDDVSAGGSDSRCSSLMGYIGSPFSSVDATGSQSKLPSAEPSPKESASFIRGASGGCMG